MTTFIESVMSTFSQSWPNVFVDISVGNMQEMLNDIASGEADMAVAFGPIGNPELKRHSFQWGPSARWSLRSIPSRDSRW